MENKIKVTEPDLPDLEDLQPYLEKIWSEKWITNGGKYHRDLETKLCSYLDVPHLSLTANGTLSLLLALKALDMHGLLGTHSNKQTLHRSLLHLVVFCLCGLVLAALYRLLLLQLAHQLVLLLLPAKLLTHLLLVR